MADRRRPSSDDEELIDEIRQEIAHFLRLAGPLLREHRARLPEPVVRFDLRGQAAGQAHWVTGQPPQLRFNLTLARRHRRSFVAQTVPHEVAHLVTAACYGRTRPHGAEWRSVMARFGQPDARACHDFEIPPDSMRRQRRWAYACGCRRHALSTTRHRRIQSGRSRYHCARCGHALTAVEAIDHEP
jgi:SprT protein